jgi:excisionase family DNA binding protein
MPVRNVPAERPFLTVQEVSELLRVSVYTVRRWIKAGALPAYKVGRGWRIKNHDLNQWLVRQRPSEFSERQMLPL